MEFFVYQYKRFLWDCCEFIPSEEDLPSASARDPGDRLRALRIYLDEGVARLRPPYGARVLFNTLGALFLFFCSLSVILNVAPPPATYRELLFWWGRRLLPTLPVVAIALPLSFDFVSRGYPTLFYRLTERHFAAHMGAGALIALVFIGAAALVCWRRFKRAELPQSAFIATPSLFGSPKTRGG